MSTDCARDVARVASAAIAVCAATRGVPHEQRHFAAVFTLRIRMNGSNAPASGIGDRIVGKVKEVAGSLIGDEDLEHEGELHQERADAARTATERAADAENARADAELASREHELVAEEQALRSEEAAEARRVALEREQQSAEARIDQENEARRVAAEVDEVSALRRVALDEAEAQRNLDAERREAAALEAEATRARATAAALDEAADRTEGRS
jgi:uncharacterized protein YjbJ (UPF0337 family)